MILVLISPPSWHSLVQYITRCVHILWSVVHIRLLGWGEEAGRFSCVSHQCPLIVSAKRSRRFQDGAFILTPYVEKNKFQSQFAGWDIWVHYHYLTQMVHHPFIHNPEVIWSPYQFITASEVSLSKELTIAKLPHDLLGSLCLFMGMQDYHQYDLIYF